MRKQLSTISLLLKHLNLILCCLGIFLLTGCAGKVKNTYPVPMVQEVGFAQHTFLSNNYLTSVEELGGHQVRYIGRKDSIIIDEPFTIDRSIQDYSFPLSNDLKIVVNTHQIVSEINSNTNNDYKAYPLLIENISSKNLRIGSGEELGLLLLAKIKGGNWKVITQSNSYNGFDPIVLKPNNTAVTFCGITNGKIEADLKYVLPIEDGMIESNTFSGRIKSNEGSTACNDPANLIL